MTLGRRRNLLLPSLIGMLLLAGVLHAVWPASERGKPAPAPLRAQPLLEPATTSAPAADPPSTARDRGLVAELQRVWSESPAGCLAVAVSGELVFSANADAPTVPASTLKLATAAAVLRGLGAGTRLSTTVVAEQTVGGDGVLRGDLWMVGGGDPVLATNAWVSRFRVRPLQTSLDELADALVATGLRVIEGRVLGDDSRFDAVRQVPTWPTHFVESNEVGPLAALTVNDGFRAWGGEHGVPFENAPEGAAATLRDLLVARGVAIRSGVGVGTAPSTARVLTKIDSAPVGDIVAAMLRDSDNGSAELLLKELGRRTAGRGSTAAGARAAAEELNRLGFPMTGVRIVDGSGLDPGNRTTCAFFLALLQAGGQGELAPAIDAGLPVAGRTGTLERRLEGPAAGLVRAKTGSFHGVAGLVGYADVPQRRGVAFAYLLTDLQNAAVGRRLQTALANSLVTLGALPARPG